MLGILDHLDVYATTGAKTTVRAFAGWPASDSAVQEKTYKFACSDDHVIEYDDYTTAVGSTIDIEFASYRNDTGTADSLSDHAVLAQQERCLYVTDLLHALGWLLWP